MLHPVGPLPASVYWRRRALVLTLLLSVGGGGWVGHALATGRFDDTATTAAATRPAATTIAEPAIERVVPALAGVQTPTVTTSAAAPAPPAPEPGGPCTDDMIDLAVRTPGSAPAASKPTFEMVVTNVSPVPCVRALDKGLQEMLLFDGTGRRVWSSTDCFPEASSDLRTLAPGEAVTFPVQWGGLSSEPTCTAPRLPPAPGAYVVKARLDTETSPEAPFTIG